MSKQNELREVLRRDAKMDISVQTDAVILLDLLEAALAEEFERGRQSVKVEVETYLASECAHRTRPTGGFYGGEHYGPPEGEEAYDIIDGVRAVLTGSSK